LTWSFSVPPHFYEVIFCLGLVVQFLFSTTWITSSAVVTLWLLHNIAEWVLGTPLTPRPFDPAIFLGLTFLVTDPVTSPRSAPAKSIFGVLYGLGIFGAFIVLRWIQEPSYFDKILAVPVLNLLVPWCEVAGDRLRALSRTVFRRDFNLGRAGALAVYVVIFLLMIGEMTKGSQGFETPLPIHSVQLSATMQELRIRSEAFRLVHPEVYSPFAWREEWRNYRRLSSYAPKTVDEHVAFGRTYAALGRLDDALRILQTAVQLDPESADAQLYLGHTYLQRGQFADATRHLVAALEIRPDDPEAQLYLGTAWGMMGRTAEAMEQFRRTLTVEPNNATALVNLGRLLVEQGDTKEGLNCLYRAVETHPASVVAHWHLATVLYRRGEFDQARRHFERVVFILPDHAEARRMLVSVAAKH